MSAVLAWALMGLGVVVLFLYGFLTGPESCSDSPTGQHEDMRVRTPTGIAVECIFCRRISRGIDAWPRQT
jgi:hypothetical protein